MSYLPVDDQAHCNLKFRRASMAARGLWVTVGSWVAGQMTDGHVPADVVRMYGGTASQIRSLVTVGMWHEHGHSCPRCPKLQPGDYYMHDYLQNGNRSRAEIQARREASAASTQRHRNRQQPRPTPPPADEQLDLDDAAPDPPAPTRTPIPADWEPSRDDVHAAQTARADAKLPPLTADQVDAVTRKFVRRQIDDGRTAVAWGGRWREWAEKERTTPAPAPDGNVVPFARAAGGSTADQRAAAAYQLAAQLAEQENGS